MEHDDVMYIAGIGVGIAIGIVVGMFISGVLSEQPTQWTEEWECIEWECLGSSCTYEEISNYADAYNIPIHLWNEEIHMDYEYGKEIRKCTKEQNVRMRE